MSTIPLRMAFLCVYCETVGSSATRCAACASETSLMSLRGILDRTQQSQMRPEQRWLAEVNELDAELRADARRKQPVPSRKAGGK